MPIQFPSFESATFEQANPFLKGYGIGQDLISEAIKQRLNDLNAQKQSLEMPFVEPMAKQDLLAAQLKNQMTPLQIEELKLRNQFYGPNMQSEIANRNAMTNKYNTMTPLEAEELRLKNKFYPQLTRSQIDSQNALSNFRSIGGMRGMGVGQRDIQALQQQIMMDNPSFTPQQVNQAASAYLSGEESLPSGEALPPLSGISQALIGQIYKRNSNAAIQNQAAQMDVLYDELSNFDIDAVKEFSGIRGKAKLAQAYAQMQANPNDPTIDPMARRFISSMQQSIINMDAMRKAFGTSVVPDYVYKTIGRLTNPADSIWNDPTQVEKNYKTVVDSIKRSRDIIRGKARFGSTFESKKENNQPSEEKNSEVIKITRDKNGKLVRS